MLTTECGNLLSNCCRAVQHEQVGPRDKNEDDVKIHGWVLMTNHIHLLVTPQSDSGVSQMIQTLGRLYVRHFNYSYQRTGTLFEGRFMSSVV